MTFLSMMDKWRPLAQDYCDLLLDRFRLSYYTHSRYPVIDARYRNLFEHPKETTNCIPRSPTKGQHADPSAPDGRHIPGKRSVAGSIARLICSDATLATDEIRLRFQSALRIPKAGLTREDEKSYKAISPWDRFERAEMHTHPTGQLIVNATPNGTRPVPFGIDGRTHHRRRRCCHEDADRRG